MFKLTLQEIAKKKNVAEPITLWFVRHGESTANLQGEKCLVEHDTELTETGQNEAAQAATYFKDNSIEVSDIYTSPLVRCTQTADIIADKFQLTSYVDNNLRERQWGELKNHTWKDLATQLDEMDIEERYAFVPEGGESWQQMESRLFTAIGTIIEASSGSNIVIVTHKGCLRAILTALSESGKLHHATHSVKTGSITPYILHKNS
jgi:broad specificity phosphatase PhoE